MRKTKTNPQRFSGDWETKRLGEIGTFVKGRGIKRDDVSDEGLPCVRYGELYTRYKDYILKVESRIPPSVAETALPIKTGDLLFAGSGETAEEIGRCAAYLGKEKAYAGGDVIVLTTIGQNPIYLGHLMNHPIVSGQKARMGQGDAVVHIYISNLARVQIELPPITEQNAIAEVLLDVDGLLNALEALIAKKQVVKQATMQQLLTGKTRLPGFSGAWETKRLGDLGNCLRGVSYDPTTDLSSYDKDSTVRLFRANNIQDAVVTLDDVQYVEARKVSEFQVMQPDDILVCMANGSKELVGKAGLFCVKDSYTYTFGAFMGCFRVEPTIAEPNFVFYIFQTHGFRNFINLILAGSSINNLKPSDIESAEFQVPDREEQRAIISVLSDIDAEIAALEQRRDKTHAIKQGMMQQLLTGRVRLLKSEIV